MDCWKWDFCYLDKKICVNSTSPLGKDVRLTASMADTIAELKKLLEEQEEIDVSRQRWFFSGKLLTDKTRLQDTKIQKEFVVQVIVNINPSVITNWGKWSKVKKRSWLCQRWAAGTGVGDITVQLILRWNFVYIFI